tara:strand:+ start:549 stop:728 length:180 start_codon:yes stop_codon:yes gene_type:complete
MKKIKTRIFKDKKSLNKTFQQLAKEFEGLTFGIYIISNVNVSIDEKIFFIKETLNKALN